MKNNTSRILIETMVRKTLRDIDESPERSTRNLVDMALHFSEGRFQQNFFRTAQTMLENESSAYYSLIQDVVSHTDRERLVTFGMNLGYNSCTKGAKTIRQIEAERGFNVPWTIMLHLDPQSFAKNAGRYHALIAQGEQLGIHTWMLFINDIPHELLSLIETHPNSAFILFCEPLDLRTSVLESVVELNNLMLAIRYCDGTEEACTLLRAMQLLYAVYYPYGTADEYFITSEDFFSAVEAMHPVFAGLMPSRDCPITTRHLVYQTVQNVREQQSYQTIPLEIFCDISRIDNIISEDTCSVEFDQQGELYTQHTHQPGPSCNLFQNDLRSILQNALPKKEAGHK